MKRTGRLQGKALTLPPDKKGMRTGFIFFLSSVSLGVSPTTLLPSCASNALYRDKHNIVVDFQAESNLLDKGEKAGTFTEPETNIKGAYHGKGIHFPTPRL
jgi:hypothetical protein